MPLGFVPLYITIIRKMTKDGFSHLIETFSQVLVTSSVSPTVAVVDYFAGDAVTVSSTASWHG